MNGIYDADYFENGKKTGKSGYENYHWMADETVMLAQALVKELPIKPGELVLDYGCAKGFLVKALQIIGIDAFGVDISEYAIQSASTEMFLTLKQIRGYEEVEGNYDWVIVKDVLEHIEEQELVQTLTHLARHTKKLFALIPLGDGRKFIIPDCEQDKTHVQRRTRMWWSGALSLSGFSLKRVTNKMPGIREERTAKWPTGIGFFICESAGRKT